MLTKIIQFSQDDESSIEEIQVQPCINYDDQEKQKVIDEIDEFDFYNISKKKPQTQQ